MEEKKIKRDRNTSTKEDILAILKQKKQALAHKDFQNAFEKNIDRVTIYRALDRLVLEGKIHKITNFDGIIQYALCSECHNHSEIEVQHHHHNHAHFYCNSCKETTCINDCVPNIILDTKYKILETQILINGICDKCNL
jgi:Fur family transcriptional regulator, ferric uptake regulator